jgi:hypothetical protein
MRWLAHGASLVMVLLLASAGTASAECAWVMWLDAVSRARGEHALTSPHSCA